MGASAGGIESLREVVSHLPAGFRVPIFVVLHIPSHRESLLPAILTKAGCLPAHHPQDGEPIEGGHIYVAPPDHHLLIEGPTLAVKRGPKENRFRPSIDALFRSAAYTYGKGAIGVVLSGALDDGTSGLWSIKRLGGVAIVQCPEDALHDSMPRSALQQVEVDHRLSAKQMGPLLAELTAASTVPTAEPESPLRKRMGVELAIAAEANAFQNGIMQLGELTPFSCPECHGVLMRIPESKRSRYRCHTGHAYSDSALLESVMEATGNTVGQMVRALEEATMLLYTIGQDLANAGDPSRGQAFFR